MYYLHCKLCTYLILFFSQGASAVLLFGAIDSPLAQPRNIMLGQTIGAIVGVVIAQLFLGIKQTWQIESQRVAVEWVGGATAMALALVIMQMTKTVHPPGGATALIPVVTPSIMEIKWFYIGVVVLSSFIQVVIACLVNNVERKYPQYWWSPKSLPLQIDPTTLATVMSTHSNPKEEIVSDNFTQAEERRFDRHLRQNQDNQDNQDNRDCNDHVSVVVQGMAEAITSRSSSSTIYEKPYSVDKAISVLQKHAHTSDTKYCFISPGLPLIATPGLLTTTEKHTLDNLLQKLSQASSPVIY